MFRLFLIFVGGGSGSILRYLVSGWAQRLSKGAFPIGTLTVNITGCILIGILASLFTGPYLIRDDYRMGILVGVLGGYTTFSSFSWETISLTNDREFWFASLNVLLSIALGLAATWVTNRLVHMVFST